MAFWIRVRRRLRREVSSLFHAWEDRKRIDAFRARGLLSEEEMKRALERLDSDRPLSISASPHRDEPSDDSPRHGLVLASSPQWAVDSWRRQDPDWPSRAVEQASEALTDRVTLFGNRYDLACPRAWHRDPLRSKPWPLRPHSRIRLSDPDRSGDVRMQWEPARFHHGLLLGRAWLATGDPVYPDAFLRHVDSFERGNPPFRSIHWSVGMEVAIRATALILSLEFLRGAKPLTGEWRERLTRLLLLHGLFLESHLERHPLGFTTNHTVADHAGLAVLGRYFAETSPGKRWLDLASRGLVECLQEQVLAGGAHAEASLPYGRFALEASLVAALCLDPDDASRLKPSLAALARHLRSACLPGGMPFIGDGDESFFPPFGFPPYEERNPLDPEPVLQVAAHVTAETGLSARSEVEEAAFWLGVPPREPSPGSIAAAPVAPAVAPAPTVTTRDSCMHLRGSGFVTFSAGPFEGVLIARGRGEGWMPTHGHNDLLSVVLDVCATPLLIDPGTGGYGWDRALRQRLRSTAAHSTLQVDDQEQSPIRGRATFEGPAEVPCAVTSCTGGELRVEAWHEGFDGVRHVRRVSDRNGRLVIEDSLSAISQVSDRGPSRGDSGMAAGDVTSTLRFRLGTGLQPRLEDVSEDPSARQRVLPTCSVEAAGGTVLFQLLRPRDAQWEVRDGEVSRRYASVESASVLEAVHRGPLPHRWVTVLRYDHVDSQLESHPRFQQRASDHAEQSVAGHAVRLEDIGE